MNALDFCTWTNTRQMEKSQFFPLYFFNKTLDNVIYVADTLSIMHGTHKNSPYGQILRNQKNILFFWIFMSHGLIYKLLHCMYVGWCVCHTFLLFETV